MSDQFIPPAAIEAARYALGCCYQPTEETFHDEHVPELNSMNERRWGADTWRAAVRQVLGDMVGLDAFKLPPWYPTFRFFKDTEHALPLAITADRYETLGTQDKCHIKPIYGHTLPRAVFYDCIREALDMEVKRSGL